MIISLIIFGSIGWVLVLIFLFNMGSQKEKEVDYKVIHISALFDGRVAKLFKCGIIEGIPVVSQEDLDTISRKIESGENSEGGREALAIVEELSMRVEEGDFITVCNRLKSPAIIVGELQDVLELRGVKCISIKSLDEIGKGRIFIGNKIHVGDVKYGYNKANGRLEDGTIVKIEGKFPKKRPLTLDCRVEAVVEGETFRKIWARWKND